MMKRRPENPKLLKKSSKPDNHSFSRQRPPTGKPHIESTPAALDDDDMRLNKYIAHCGIASRRAAATLIAEGKVKVNGAVVREIGYRVLPTDKVLFEDNPVEPVRQMVYILLNKPKDTITTAKDERGRKTVMDIVGSTVKERVYPVGRLDRETLGLLLLTNDGDLAQKLSHPSYMIKKIYHVILTKPLTADDLRRIAEGLNLEDGIAQVDAVGYAANGGKEEVMVELHIGKNRIVRRIFEHLGYEIAKLDRVYYGGLTKKDLPRGFYRPLTEREVIMLKHFSGTHSPKKPTA
jgi:23S rRNA pseudouridine2605 synthase